MAVRFLPIPLLTSQPLSSTYKQGQELNWASKEFKTLVLGNKRLNAHPVLLAQCLADKPTKSIQSTCNGWAETLAAYRFLNNPRSDWQGLLPPHWTSSLECMRTHE